jgi:hypothetical protein
MGQLQVISERDGLGAVGARLSALLPPDYIVLVGPKVCPEHVAMVVIGPQWLTILGVWPQAAAARKGLRWPRWLAWREAWLRRRRQPAEERAARAVRGLLRQVMPTEQPTPAMQYVWLAPPGDSAPSPASPALSVEGVASMLSVLPVMEAALPAEMREAIADALQEGPLLVGQRTQQPFVFRHGVFLGSGHKVWTVRGALRHMARDPEDGIYHLRNGTLVQWLEEEGALRLAGVAREALRQAGADERRALADFLLNTGLVRRPRLVVRPRRLDLGYILAGEAATATLRVRRGRGRGYLYGAAAPRDGWLRVDPQALQDGKLEATVTAQTSRQLLRPQGTQSAIALTTNASEEPREVPVRLRVVGQPTALNRSVLRPLVGLLAAGALGALVGWAFGARVVTLPGWVSGLGLPEVPIAWAWAGIVGFFWALLGLLRGLLQPAALPTLAALGRWLLATALWALALALVGVAVYGTLALFYPELGLAFSTELAGSVALAGVALAIIPATASRPRTQPLALGPAGRRARRDWLAAAGIVLLFALLFAGSVTRPAWQKLDVSGPQDAAQRWAGEQRTALQQGIDRLIERYYMWRYDRRQPVQPTTVPARPKPTRTPAP